MRFRFAALAVLAPLCAEEIKIKPTFRAGDRFELDVTRTRTDSQRPQMNGWSKTRVTVQVREVTAAGTVLEWIPGDTSFSNPEVMKNPVMAAAAKSVKGIRFELVLAPDGKFTSLRNEAAISARLEKMLGTMIAGLGPQIPDEAQRKQVENMVRQAMQPRALVASAMRDSQLYLGINGIAVRTGESFAMDLEQPAPLGGGTIQAKFFLDLTKTDARSATLESRTVYDKAVLKAMMAKILVQMGGNAPKPLMAENAPELNVHDKGSYTFDKTIGLMREVRMTKSVSAGVQKRVDEWEIRLAAEPAAPQQAPK